MRFIDVKFPLSRQSCEDVLLESDSLGSLPAAGLVVTTDGHGRGQKGSEIEPVCGWCGTSAYTQQGREALHTLHQGRLRFTLHTTYRTSTPCCSKSISTHLKRIVDSKEPSESIRIDPVLHLYIPTLAFLHTRPT